MEKYVLQKVYPLEQHEFEGRQGRQVIEVKGFLFTDGLNEIYAECVGTEAKVAEQNNYHEGEEVTAVFMFRHREYTDKNNMTRHSIDANVLRMARYRKVQVF